MALVYIVLTTIKKLQNINTELGTGAAAGKLQTTYTNYIQLKM